MLCPPGGASPCQTTNYDPVLPVMYPYAVNYTAGKYRGEALRGIPAFGPQAPCLMTQRSQL